MHYPTIPRRLADPADHLAQGILDNPAITSFSSRDINQKQWAGLTGRNETTGKNYLRAALEHLLVAIAIVTTHPASALDDAHWYMGHVNEEICVPLDDIGPNNTRLYFGGGPYRVPQDLVHQMIKDGLEVKNLTTGLSAGEAGYSVRFPGERLWSYMLFFSNREQCIDTMSRIEK
jgi:hypothetical protein